MYDPESMKGSRLQQYRLSTPLPYLRMEELHSVFV
ncbi:MAG: hypothetical protein EWM72_03201 [Nitrospira sp.]|nr:MAG: hypothetical protein EWM72_03201 [Nitrospira sp.]